MNKNINYLPARQPPKGTTGFIFWLRTHLFSSWGNTLLSLFAIAFLACIIPPISQWAILQATWSGNSASDCQTSGACWAFIHARLPQFFYGFYPEMQRWRVNIVFLILLPSFLCSCFLFKNKWRVVAQISTMLLLPTLGWIILRGDMFGLSSVPTNLWGGMMLTLVIASIGILFSLLFGILLALGRSSDMPVIRWICVFFIETWRGVPLITILFMASVMLPMFLPPNWNVNPLVRALIGVACFASAYMAEVIRGGLQGLDKGQYEAADSIGLGYLQKMRLVIMPQVLTTMIPAITNTYVGLFKETTLVSIIGLYDFLGIVQSASQDPKWLGKGLEGYVFCGIVYFIICYSVSSASYRLENKLSVEIRQ